MTDSAWAVASTKPQAEEIAEKAIREAGYEPWLPMYRKRLVGARIHGGRRIRSRADSVVMRPVFRCYLFVLVPYGDDAYAIDAAHGVHRLLRYPASAGDSWGKPKIMRSRVMLQLRDAIDSGKFDEVRSNGSMAVKAVKVGDNVRTAGGFVGTLLSLDEQGRYELLSEYMGAKRPIRGDDAWTLEAVLA